MAKNNYDIKSIKTLTGLEPFRKSPGMYIGSTGAYGLFHIVKEIVNNSVDEYLNSSVGDYIEITLLKDGGIKIKDNGRGFPHGMVDETFSVLGACYGKEHTGGKFLNSTGTSGYNSSGGMHGIGGKCAAALGEKTLVYSYRDGLKDIVEFSRGKMLKQEINIPCDKDLHGAEVYWYPDKEIFTETIEFDKNKIETELCQEYSFLNEGLKITIIEEKTNYKKEYYSTDGIRDYLNYLNGNKSYLLNPIILHETDGDFSVEVGIAYNESYSNTIKLYTNSIPQSKGTHLTGFKTAWTSAINSYARENNWLKEKDANLSGSDLEEGQLLIINFKMIDPIFEGQIKDTLTSSEGRTYVQKLVSSTVKDYFNDSIKNVINKALNARKAREAAKKARDAARDTSTKKTGLKSKMAMSNKFIDCINKDPSQRNLLLVEGLSAGSSAVEARNNKTDAIYMLRGKTVSPLKTTLDKILANQEMHDIVTTIGAGIGNNFNLDKMNYDKIVITSDQDSDGFSIELLLTTFFYTYMRPLVEAGKLYRAVTPLYIIRQKGKESYCYSDKELEDWKATHSGAYDLTRAKG